MNNFWSLVGFEYKKIVKRKSFLIALLIMLFVSTFCMVGNVINGYEYEQAEKTIQHNKAGYIDNQMLSEVIAKNVEARDKIDENGNYEGDIYDSNVRPYNSVRSQLARILSPVDAFDFENFNRLDSAQGLDFYKLRTKSLEDKLEFAGFSEKETAKTLELNSKLKTPFYTDYYYAYANFLLMMSTSSIFILLALCICIAPIFADEFQKKTDSVILSSKYGKSQLILAKIFTAITFSLLFVTAALIIAVITTFLVCSSFGGNVSFQTWDLYSVYPLTMAKALLIQCAIIICVTLLISTICLALSATTSTFATISTLMVLLAGGMFFNIPFESLRTLNFILPAQMLNEINIFSSRLVCVFGMYIKPYVFIPIVCFLLAIIFLPIAYKSFKNHQAG